MGGIAAIARAAGHRVSGSDRNVYPPMSTQLAALGIELSDGFGAGQLEPRPDVVVVGNVCTRGMPVIEALLESDIPYTSGPEWLARDGARRSLGARGRRHARQDHDRGDAGLDPGGCGPAPGFLIGGIPGNFPVSARLGEQPFFVIEADEYDTAFFDKRAKFVHYRPRTLVLNNLEFDHADIYPDLAAIERQFHHLVRIVPGSGRVLVNARTPTWRACWRRAAGARWSASRAIRGTATVRSGPPRCPRAATARSSRCAAPAIPAATCAGR